MKAAYKVFGPSYKNTPPGELSPYGGFEVTPLDPEKVIAFVTSVGPDRLISVTVHGDNVAVWYWDDGEAARAAAGGEE